jgi:hypothetical protein
MKQADLLGTWVLQSFVAETKDGRQVEPWGSGPRGKLVYTADGSVIAVLTRATRPKFASSEPLGGTAAESKDAFDAMEAYAGTYTFEKSANSVLHRVDVSKMPSWEGTTLVRYPSLEGNELTMRTPSMVVQGVEMVLVFKWRRAESTATR